MQAANRGRWKTVLQVALVLGSVVLGVISLARPLALANGDRASAAQGAGSSTAPTVAAIAATSPWASATPTWTASPSATPTNTPKPTATATRTPLPTPSSTPSPISTATPVHAPAQANPTSLEIPLLGLDLALAADDLDAQGLPINAPAGATLFVQDTAWPGYAGNTVVLATWGGSDELVAAVAQLQAGDQMLLWVDVIPYRYRVQGVYSLPVETPPADGEAGEAPERLQWIRSTDDQRLTFIAGWPCQAEPGCVAVVALPDPWP